MRRLEMVRGPKNLVGHRIRRVFVRSLQHRRREEEQPDEPPQSGDQRGGSSHWQEEEEESYEG